MTVRCPKFSEPHVLPIPVCHGITAIDNSVIVQELMLSCDTGRARLIVNISIPKS